MPVLTFTKCVGCLKNYKEVTELLNISKKKKRKKNTHCQMIGFCRFQLPTQSYPQSFRWEDHLVPAGTLITAVKPSRNLKTVCYDKSFTTVALFFLIAYAAPPLAHLHRGQQALEVGRQTPTSGHNGFRATLQVPTMQPLFKGILKSAMVAVVQIQ